MRGPFLYGAPGEIERKFDTKLSGTILNAAAKRRRPRRGEGQDARSKFVWSNFGRTSAAQYARKGEHQGWCESISPWRAPESPNLSLRALESQRSNSKPVATTTVSCRFYPKNRSSPHSLPKKNAAASRGVFHQQFLISHKDQTYPRARRELKPLLRPRLLS